MIASALASFILLCASGPQGPGVPNFPTPEPAVEQMLDLAAVTKEDLVYDLGCGDGRIVIAAAKRGASGVGVDIDPKCVAQSREIAARAGVTDRTTFIVQDLFKTDIAKATVVALYLSPEMDVKLRPRLLKELKPGTRIVSHVYDMGEWKPDKTVPVRGSEKFNLYLWIIPARVAGTWRWSAHTGSSVQSDEFRLEQTYQRISGTFSYRGVPLAIIDGRLNGNHLELTANGNISGGPMSMELTAVVSGRKIEGNVRVEGGGSTKTFPLAAELEP